MAKPTNELMSYKDTKNELEEQARREVAELRNIPVESYLTKPSNPPATPLGAPDRSEMIKNLNKAVNKYEGQETDGMMGVLKNIAEKQGFTFDEYAYSSLEAFKNALKKKEGDIREEKAAKQDAEMKAELDKMYSQTERELPDEQDPSVTDN